MKNLTALKVTCYFVTLGLITSCDFKPYVQTNLKLTQDTIAFGDPKPLDTLETSENSYQSCIVRDMQWTPGSAESILLEPTDWVFPGNVLDAKSLQDGSYITIVGDRKSINLVIDGQIFNKMSIEVPNPGQKSIKDAIISMLKSGKIGSQPADVTLSAKEVYSEDHLKLMMHSKYSAGFGSLAAGFDFNNTNISTRYLLDLTQIYYTINTETPLSGFFKKKPKQLTESSPAPVYISSIKYGRRVMIIVETQKSDEQKEADFKAQFNTVASSGSLDVNMFSEKFFSDKSIKILVKGGNADNTYNVWKAVSNKKEIFDILAKDAQWSLNNLGVPLAYQVRNTSDNSNFYISQTGTYKARICTLKSQNDTTINVSPFERLCAFHVGGDDRNFGDNPDANFSIKLEADKNIVRCKIEGFMKEPGGDGTAGSIIVSRNIIELPDDFTIIQITSPSEMTQPTVRLGNKGQNPFTFDAQRYPVSLVSIIGDSNGNNDDDLYPGECVDDIHAQIRTIVFNPISIRYTRKVKKVH